MMDEGDRATLDLIRSFDGLRLTRAERERYVFRGDVGDGGELQLWLGDSVLRFAVGRAAEHLRAETTPWRDLFVEPLTPDTFEFLATHGRWVLFDVSAEAEYRDVVGRTIVRVLPLTNKFETLIGVQLDLSTTKMNVFVEADELIVTFGDDAVPSL
jgi:hypothetical protein